jgi:hypothetical protein
LNDPETLYPLGILDADGVLIEIRHVPKAEHAHTKTTYAFDTQPDLPLHRARLVRPDGQKPRFEFIQTSSQDIGRVTPERCGAMDFIVSEIIPALLSLHATGQLDRAQARRLQKTADDAHGVKGE